MRPYATLEEWKDKIAEVNIETLGEAGWALETLIDEIIYLKQQVRQLKSRWEKEEADEAGAGQSIAAPEADYGIED